MEPPGISHQRNHYASRDWRVKALSGVDQGIVFGRFSTSGEYRDNLTSSVTTAYVTNGNGVDAGNNN